MRNAATVNSRGIGGLEGPHIIPLYVMQERTSGDCRRFKGNYCQRLWICYRFGWRNAAEGSKRLATCYMRLVESTAITPVQINAQYRLLGSYGFKTIVKKATIWGTRALRPSLVTLSLWREVAKLLLLSSLVVMLIHWVQYVESLTQNNVVNQEFRPFAPCLSVVSDSEYEVREKLSFSEKRSAITIFIFLLLPFPLTKCFL